MIYTLGCSMTKWYWPTWADWLQVYGGPVTNLAYTGYGHNHQEWILLDHHDMISPNDHVVVMWPPGHRTMQWYDREWIDQMDCEGFFPNKQGKLWFTESTPWSGLYRTHPDHSFSFTHSIIQGFLTILHTQHLLEKTGCKITMAFVQNPWLDSRPMHSPKFQTRWQLLDQMSDKEMKFAKNLWQIGPFQNLMNQINWSYFIGVPDNLENVSQYKGIWEFFLQDREYVIYKHDHDHHPTSITHHDWALKNLLKIDPKSGQYRNLAKQISKEAMCMELPEFSAEDAVATPTNKMLFQKFSNLINV